VGWLTRWPELRDVVVVCIGAVVVLTGLGVWVVTGRVLPWGFLGGGFTAIGVPAALAMRRIVSTGSSSASQPPLSSSPSSSPLPEARDGE
jgi:hypothetical protein